MAQKKYFFYFPVLFLFLIIYPAVFISAEKECFPQYECGEWGECNQYEIQKRICSDVRCGSTDITERKFCDGRNCEPEFKCTKWSSCNYVEKVTNVFKDEISFQGYQERVCYDTTGCMNEDIERISCGLSVPIKTKEVEWCGEDYIEIFDSETDKLVSRIKSKKISESSDLKRVDISFPLTGFSGFCDYCFDGIKNYDETEIDCGGNFCKECSEKREFFDWRNRVILFFWVFFGSLIILFFWKYETDGVKINRIFKVLRPVTREEARIKEEKIKELFKKILGIGGEKDRIKNHAQNKVERKN